MWDGRKTAIRDFEECKIVAFPIAEYVRTYERYFCNRRKTRYNNTPIPPRSRFTFTERKSKRAPYVFATVGKLERAPYVLRVKSRNLADDVDERKVKRETTREYVALLLLLPPPSPLRMLFVLSHCVCLKMTSDLPLFLPAPVDDDYVTVMFARSRQGRVENWGGRRRRTKFRSTPLLARARGRGEAGQGREEAAAAPERIDRDFDRLDL